MGHIVQLFETGDGVLAVGVWLARSVWEVFDTNEASSLQNQEQMALENEAPLRSIETPSNDPPHTSFSPPHTQTHTLSSINEPFPLPRLFKSTCYGSRRCHVFFLNS